jgi:DNA-binding beta-propeller fold protein YncE
MDFVIDPTGSRLYVLGAAGVGPPTTWSGYLTEYDTATLTPISSVLVQQNGNPGSLALTPDGSMLFTADNISPNAYMVDANTLQVTQLPAPPSTVAATDSLVVMIP